MDGGASIPGGGCRPDHCVCGCACVGRKGGVREKGGSEREKVV